MIPAFHRRLTRTERRRILRENRGLLARVARRAHVNESGVSRVWWGQATSARISRIIDRELKALGFGTLVEALTTDGLHLDEKRIRGAP